MTAVDLIREGRAAALVAGSADAIFETFYKGHDRFAVMSRTQAFSARLAPFDAGRDGFVLGEARSASGWNARHRAISRRPRRDPRASRRRARRCRSMPLAGSGRSRWCGTMRLALEDAGLERVGVDVDTYVSRLGQRDRGARCRRGEALPRSSAADRAVVTSVKGALGEFGAAGGARVRGGIPAQARPAGCRRSPA